MRVALDLDSTLAATLPTTFDLLETDHTYEDVTSWSWGTDKFGTARFLNAVWHAWTIRPESIAPMEDGIRASVALISNRASQVDVVTKHPDGMLGVDDGKKRWLDKFNIPFDNYVSTSDSKLNLDYDVYIDDNPELAQQVADTDATVLLRDHPYNRGINLPAGAERVYSVRDASKWFPKPQQ